MFPGTSTPAFSQFRRHAPGDHPRARQHITPDLRRQSCTCTCTCVWSRVPWYRFPTFTSCRKYTKLQAQLVIPSTAISICVHVGLLMHAARHTAIIHTTRAQCVARHLPSLPLSVRKPRSARTPTRQPTLAISAPSWPRDSYRPVPIHRIPPAAARQPFRHRSRPLPISVVPPPPNPPVSHTVRYTRASLHLHKRGCARRKQRAAATEPQKGKNGNGANSKGSDDSGDKSG